MLWCWYEAGYFATHCSYHLSLVLLYFFLLLRFELNWKRLEKPELLTMEKFY